MSWSTSDRRERLPDDWDAIRLDVFRRLGKRCLIKGAGCLGRATEVDHIRAGDDHSPANLRPACSRCHGRKSSAEGNAMRARLRAAGRRRTPRHPGWRPPPKES